MFLIVNHLVVKICKVSSFVLLKCVYFLYLWGMCLEFFVPVLERVSKWVGLSLDKSINDREK